MSDTTVAIVTFRDDLHALAIRSRYRDLIGRDCAIIEADALAGSDGLTWTSESAVHLIPVVGGGWVDVRALDVLWYRRGGMPQLVSSDDDDHRQYIDRCVGAVLRGILDASFMGTWISAPEATQSAENKIAQLRAATSAGLAVPRTVISQNPTAVREFVGAMNGAVVMKGIRPSKRQALMTLALEPQQIADDAAIRVCPTIFQEFIPGERHLRVLCAGDILAMEVCAPEVDWRPRLDAETKEFALDSDTRRRIHRLLDILNLRMGVLDFKFRDDEPVFLEINPQGQFLFMEAMAGMDVRTPFVEFLHRVPKRRLSSEERSLDPSVRRPHSDEVNIVGRPEDALP